MYEYLKGTLIEVTPQHTILEVHNVAYKLYTPVNVLAANLPIGKECQLFTHLVIRENDHKLYGFLHTTDRELFILCSSISGIGPKTSLNLIGHFDHSALHQLVVTQNATALARVPGIGKKTAERILVELNHKLRKMPRPTAGTHPLLYDGINALVRLGYSEEKAAATVEAIIQKEQELTLPDLITQSLHNLQ